MRETIAYIGHCYHEKTKSTEFLIEYLKDFFNVDIYWDKVCSFDEFDSQLLEELNQKDYKALIFFQAVPPKKDLDSLNCKNIIYFPMQDHVKLWNFDKWYGYKDLKMINFCKATHDKLTSWGFNSIYLQYFPQPQEFISGNKDEVFFWQRVKKININTVKKLFKKKNDYKLHIHKSMDPGHEFIPPSIKTERKFKITYSLWFETREEMFDLIKQKQIYIAPRRDEGIGMSFLEAMAMGKAVVANNDFTMNEYIKNGVTGYLFNYKNPRPINFSNIEQVQKNAWEFCKKGYQKWLKDRIQIIEFINSESLQIEISEFKRKLYFLTNMKKKDIIQLKFGRRGYLCLLGFWILRKKQSKTA